MYINRLQKIYFSFQNTSIQNKIMILFSIFLVGVFLLQSQLYGIQITRMTEEKASAFVAQTLQQVSGQIDSYINSLESITNMIVSSESIRQVLIENTYPQALAMDTSPPFTMDGQWSYEQKEVVQTELSKITLPYNNINSVQIWTPTYTLDYNFVGEPLQLDRMDQAVIARLTESQGELVLISSMQNYNNKYGGSKIHSFSAVRKMQDFLTGSTLGYVFVNVNKRVIYDILADIHFASADVHVYEKDGRIISSPQNDLLDTLIPASIFEKIRASDFNGSFLWKDQGTEYVIVTYASSKTQWGIYSQIPVHQLSAEMIYLKNINLIISLVGIFFVLLVALLISRQITRPIKSLVESMKQIGNGNLDVQAPVTSLDEIGHLSTVFNQMMAELKTSIHQYHQEQENREKADLKAICAQISPHFMYNTLDTIYWMMILKQQEDTANLVISLSEIMRYSVHREDQSNKVPLSLDLKILQHYLEIQKSRFGDKVDFELNIPSEMYSLFIPKMLLQPIVENALSHGMKNGRPLQVTIQGYGKDGKIYFTIQDNGKGISQDQLQYRLPSSASKDKQHTGFGLKSVDRQVKILYGDHYGVTLESEMNIGTTVRIILPEDKGDL